MGNALRQTAAGVYHLATRSSTPDFLFRDAADRLSLIGQLERVTLDTDWTCVAACLMGTHYHLLVDAGANVLPDAMKRINWAYAVNHNQRHGRRGHRVGSRYLSIDVDGGRASARLLSIHRLESRRSRPLSRPGGLAVEQLRNGGRPSRPIPFRRPVTRPRHARSRRDVALAESAGSSTSLICRMPERCPLHSGHTRVPTPELPGVRHLSSDERKVSDTCGQRAGERARLRERALGERRLQELLRDERARAGAEAGAGPRARADVEEPLDGGRVARRRANGRQRKFWSSDSAPPYGSPATRLTFIRSRSCGPSTTRCTIDDSRFGMCRASRAWMRSAYRSRSSSSTRRRRRRSRRGVALHAAAAPAAGSTGGPCRPARATGPSSAAGRRRPSPRPAAGRARPRSPRARRRRAPA